MNRRRRYATLAPLGRAGVLLLISSLTQLPATTRGQIVDDGEVTSVQSAEPAGKEPMAIEVTGSVQPIVEKTNELRKQEGLNAVTTNPNLMQAAQYFANFMAQNDKYGHTADGKQPSQRAAEHGYEPCLISENIAYQYSSSELAAEELAKRFYEGWKNSPGHRKNMLEPAAMETGVAVAQSRESGYFYAVQMFGRPKSESIDFAIANESGSAVEYGIDGNTFPLPPRMTRTHQRCRPAELVFKLSDASDQQPVTVKAGDGDKLVISEAEGKLKIEEM